MKTIRQAAQALCDRWDTALWKDVAPTAVFIGELRAALAREEAQTVEPAFYVPPERNECHGRGFVSASRTEKAGWVPLFTRPAPATETVKLPENCGTGHCSCIECVKPAKPSGEREALILDLRSYIYDSPTANAVMRLAADMLAADAKDAFAAGMACRPASVQQVASSTLPERDASRPAEQQGLFRKFVVQRTDGSDKLGGKHHGCEYFVLDVDHDPHTKVALRAYAAACAQSHPLLSADLIARHGAQQVAVPQKPLAKVVRVDEYGPQLDWYTHWTNLIGSNLYAAPQPPQSEEPCYCDKQGIGKPGVTCGDCPRDYLPKTDTQKSGDSHEIWAAAQLTPGEGIEAGVARVEALLNAPRVSMTSFEMETAARSPHTYAIYGGAFKAGIRAAEIHHGIGVKS